MTKKKIKTPILLDLGCGQNKREGYFGVDIMPTDAADLVYDLEQYPWPWEDDSVEGIHTSHVVEHTPMYRPDGQDGLVAFMNECHRILRKPVGTPGEDDYTPGGTLTVIHPYAMSTRAFQDPYHRRFIPEATWYYFDKNWRESQSLDHYPITADFEVVVIQGIGLDQNIQNRNAETQQFARNHYWHVLADLQIEFRAR